MPPLIQELGRYRLIVDTGPLLDFLLHRCIQEYRLVHVGGYLSLIREPIGAIRFRTFLRRHTPVVISDGVLVELEHHRQKARVRLEAFWRVAREELLAIGIDEASIRWDELPQDDLYRFGPVDASLLRLASTPVSGKKPLAIVTGDRELHVRCGQRSIKSHWIDEVVSVEW